MNQLILHTSQLELRPITIADAEAIFVYRSDKITNQYQGFIPETVEDVKTFINKCAKEADMVNTWFQLAIILKETNTIIGDVGIHYIDIAQVELGYTIAKEHQGKGYAKSALKALINDLFGEGNRHRITASIDTQNIPSIKLVESLGFRKEAHFIESYYNNGKWVDDLQYAILQREWKEIS